VNRLFIFLILFYTSLAWANDSRQVDLNWDEIPGALSYEVELFEEKGSDAYSQGIFSSRNSSWSHRVRPGKYSIRLRAVDKRGVPGEWSERFPLKVKLGLAQTLKPYVGEKITDPDVYFQWGRVPGALRYKIYVIDGANQLVVSEYSIEPEFLASIPGLGSYKWIVYAMGEDEEDNKQFSDLDVKELKSFVRVGGELEAPLLKVEIKDAILLTWAPVPNATEYDLILYPSQGKPKRSVLSSNSVQMPTSAIPEGVSTISLSAKSPEYKESKKSIVKIVRDKETITSTVRTGEGPEVVGYGDQFKQTFAIFSTLYGNGIYTASSEKNNTKVDETHLGLFGFQAEVRRKTSPQSWQQNYQAEYLSFTGVSAKSWSLQFSLGKRLIHARGREWGLASGLTLKSWPLLIPNNSENKVTSEDRRFLSPLLMVWWQDSLSLKHTLRGEVYGHYYISEEDDVDPFFGTRLKGSWLYFMSTEYAIQTFVMMDTMATKFFDNDSQKLDVLTLGVGWLKAF
jgi:hypothetical protein